MTCIVWSGRGRKKSIFESVKEKFGRAAFGKPYSSPLRKLAVNYQVGKDIVKMF